MFKRVLIVSCALLFFVFFVDNIYPTLLSKKIGSIDKIVVHKTERKMFVFRENQLVKVYSISLGGNPIGHKKQEGDSKTPEGKYIIDWKHPNSAYHIALRVSYPSIEDKVNATESGVSLGGDIMIHGMPNWFGWLYPILKNRDWTNGCIAVSNTAMEELAIATKIGTPIIILQ